MDSKCSAANPFDISVHNWRIASVQDSNALRDPEYLSTRSMSYQLVDWCAHEPIPYNRDRPDLI
jgi:hypothetical protein